MDTKNKLMLQMGVFFIIVFGLFTYIVLNEKKDIILAPKIEKKLLSYIDKNYTKQKGNLTIGKTKYHKQRNQYQIKLSNTKNKNLYFYVTYKNKKITSTYQKDYIEGNSLYKAYKDQYHKNFKNSNLIFSKKLNQYPQTIRNQVIDSDIKILPIYDIKSELTIKDHKNETIITSISNFYYKNIDLGYHPKTYTITIVDKNDISFAVEIRNLTENLIENNIDEIIYAIIENNSNIKSKYSIDYQYIN